MKKPTAVFVKNIEPRMHLDVYVKGQHLVRFDLDDMDMSEQTKHMNFKDRTEAMQEARTKIVEAFIHSRLPESIRRMNNVEFYMILKSKTK